jgi:hypothetical protein
LKSKRLEWILGYPQVIGRKGYNESLYKFGVEIIMQVNDDYRNWPSTLLNKVNEEAILSICRKNSESLSCACLSFLL